MNEDRIAYCGVDCAVCTDFTSGKCPGCRQTAWKPDDMCLPVACCQRQGVAFCGACPAFPCADMQAFYRESDSHAQAFARMNALRRKEQAAMFERIDGKRICLRKAREADALPMMQNVWSDENVYRWMLFQPTFTEEDALDRCRRSMQYQKDHFAWFVALQSTGEAIGYCGLKENEPGHFEESGICIAANLQGQGLGKEILALLLELAFDRLGATDFRYGYFDGNEKSKKLSEHFGFRYEYDYEMTRPWDGAKKTVHSCILTRDEYLQRR